MENRISVWNDQIASRRRGLSGRFMSLSKRWTGFGSSRGNLSGIVGGSNLSGTNFDADNGYYPSDTPEATMRQLADYAFMLRDWNLAYSTYELLRADYGQDKAWVYHAAANEMAAISLLLMPQTMSARSRSETVNHLLESASYSYLTRCGLTFGVTRCLTLAIELLRSRGSAFAEEAARWGGRLLELGVVSPTTQGFLSERIAECYDSRAGAGVSGWDSRSRQAALWNLLAADTWIRTGHVSRAQSCLQQASKVYSGTGDTVPLPSMRKYWECQENLMRMESESHSKSTNGFVGRSSDLVLLDTPEKEALGNSARIDCYRSGYSTVEGDRRHEVDGFE